jgi:hypothetical protein
MPASFHVAMMPWTPFFRMFANVIGGPAFSRERAIAVTS